jgi:4-hydroxybenzoate polyprenyltransferase
MNSNILREAFHYFKVTKSLLRVPTYLLLVMYLFAGLFTGIAVAGIKPSSAHLAVMLLKALVCAVAIALWYINGTALNDYADYEIDIINLKGDQDRPLVTGASTRKEILNIAMLCGMLAIFLCAILEWQSGIFMAVLLLLNVSYSIKPFQISRRGGVAPLFLPIGYVALPVYLGYMLSTNHWASAATTITVGLYLQFIGRIILKDYRDVKGDKAHGKMTFLLRYGNQAVCIVSAVMIAASCIWIILLFGNYLHAFRYSILCLLSFGLIMLQQLSKEEKWKQQKPIIAAFGRAMTGITAAIICGLVTTIWFVPASTMLFMAIILVLVYVWSAQQAFHYNTLLQSSR